MRGLELLVDFHLDAERQGPGSEADTLRALAFVDLDRSAQLKVTDIGCGSGAQSLTLAQHLNGTITAVDLFPEFLDKLNQRAAQAGLQERIITLQKSMDALPFKEAEFDLIWSEGAIYNIGFAGGVEYWKRFLRPGGFLAVSELSWTTNRRPSEIGQHWNNEYPEIGTAAEKIRVLETAGFSLRGFFFLPESSWIDNYYGPMETRFVPFLEKHKNSMDAQEIVEGEKEEIRLYRQYREYLSYGFYIAQKTEG